MTASARDAALDYISAGWSVIPVPHKSKNPGRTGWQDLRITAATAPNYFNGQRQNIGGLMGEPSGNLVDADLDVPEAVLLASRFLDPTGAVFGRQSKRKSHWLYIADPLTDTEKFKDPTDGKSIVELRSTGAQTILPGSTHPTGEPIEWETDGEPALVSGPALVGQTRRLAAAALLAMHWPDGSRHDVSLALSGGLLRAGWDTETVEAFIESVAWAAGDDEVEDRVDTVSYTAERIADGKSATGWPFLSKLIGERVVDALHDWLDIEPNDGPVFTVGASGRSPNKVTPATSSYPVPLDAAAFHGLAGDIIRAIEPETEADPVALLVTFLAGVGNIVGRNPGWTVSGARHGLRIYPVFVGETAKARKGTSLAAVRAVLSVAAPEWATNRISTGMSSGEGLVWAVRDQITKTEAIKDKGQITGYQEVIIDPGIEDKRLFVVEEEFASVIKRMDREGNTLSATIRMAWDHGNLRIMTKNSPAQATDAHITILGHITRDELLRYLTATEAGNGFGNRFLWLCVRRSKQLPRGGNFTPALITELGTALATVISNASETVGLIQPDAEAWDMWDSVYGSLSDGSSGLLGAMTSRAEPYVMRLASIYAVLDESNTITTDHLEAALAVWDYAEASARFIFGDRLGDPVADAMLNALRQRGEMSRTDIRDLFGRNASAARIDAALALLASSGKARMETRKAEMGRPAEVWTSC